MDFDGLPEQFRATIASYLSSLEEVVRSAGDIQDQKDREMSIAASCFVLGITKKPDDDSGPAMVPISDRFLAEVSAAAEKSGPAEEAMDEVRAALVKECSSRNEAFRARLLRNLRNVFDEETIVRLTSREEVSQDDAFTVGFTQAAADKTLFMAFLQHHDDSHEDMPCRCPGHMTQALVSAGIKPENRGQTTTGISKREFGNQYTALLEFGKWYAGEFRRTWFTPPIDASHGFWDREDLGDFSEAAEVIRKHQEKGHGDD